MSGMNVGDVIGIQCDIRPGPFSGERMITFDTVDGPISGFVREADFLIPSPLTGEDEAK